MRSSSGYCIGLMHILPPVTAEGFDGSHHPRFAEWCVAMNGTILNPAILPKIKIWTAAIIINFIVKHHVLQTYQCRVIHENIENY